MTGAGESGIARRRDALSIACGAAVYVALLLFRYRTVPDGLVNDTAEEALRGLILIEERRVEVLTFVLGNSAETLWLYVVGLSAKLLGPTVLAVVLPSALAAAATVVLVTLLVRTLDPETPWIVPFLLAAGSPWLFHYGRAGLRTISAPLFLTLTALLLARAVRDMEHSRRFAWVGFAAGVSIYGYTACRLLPVALILAFGIAWLREKARRREWRRASLHMLAGLLAASIPSLITLAAHPREFLTRGSYVAVGSGAGRLANTLATALLPFDYPHRYGFIWGEDHVFDGVSAGLAGSGVTPVPLAAGILFAIGIVQRLARRRDVTSLFLTLTLALAIVLLGPTGPSLTRLLVVLPVYLVFAALGATSFIRGPRTWAAVVTGLGLLTAHTFVRYFALESDPLRESREYVGAVHTAMGERARNSAHSGPVLCVVTESANIVRYLAHGAPVTVVEFYGREFEPREADPAPAIRSILVEANPRLDSWQPAGWIEADHDARFRMLVRTVTPPTGP
jgi:hypothetical protein